MPTATLPPDASAFAGLSWEDIAPFYEELANRPLDRSTIQTWLADWSRLEGLVTEAASLAMIAYTCHTTDGQKQATHLKFSTTILPQVEEQSVRLARRLVDSGYTRPDLETIIQRFRTQIEIFREANVPLFSQLEGLGSRYQEITGGMTVSWDGTELPLPQLQPFMKSTERATRERAFRAVSDRYLAERRPLTSLFDQMYALRQEVATNAGFADYQGFAFQAKNRFDYGPEDCTRFHDAVEATVVPAVGRILDRRQAMLAVDTLRPWDLGVDPHQRPPVRPFASADELAAKAQRVFASVDADLGRQFGVMIDEQLLDLDSRAGKAPGGYCDTLHDRGRPFIFMNAAGLMDDVRTLLHEAGHSFHAFASHALPLVWQRYPGAEIAELASMSMELLAAPRLAMTDGFLTEAERRDAWVEHLEDILLTLVHVASVDAFQSWIYTSGEGGNEAARDRAWLDIRTRFEPVVDWSGLEQERIARWYRQIHIFLYPFYYIEYGIAQLGALQVWRNSGRNWTETLAQYHRALALGSTTSLPEMYRTAGADLVFDADQMGALVRLVEDELESIGHTT
jgi:oligoendopeptidase F